MDRRRNPEPHEPHPTFSAVIFAFASLSWVYIMLLFLGGFQP